MNILSANPSLPRSNLFDVHFKMKIVKDELSHKGYKKSNGYNVVEGEKVLGTSMVENITFRKGTNPLKKRHYKGLDLLENPPIRTLNNSVTVE